MHRHEAFSITIARVAINALKPDQITMIIRDELKHISNNRSSVSFGLYGLVNQALQQRGEMPARWTLYSSLLSLLVA